MEEPTHISNVIPIKVKHTTGCKISDQVKRFEPLEERIFNKQIEFCNVILSDDIENHKLLKRLVNEMFILYEFVRLNDELAQKLDRKLANTD